MKAIILAAGKGTRLRDILKGEPKPLFKLNQKSLLEYSIEILMQNKIKDITIVLGYNGEVIRRKILKEFKNINFVENKIYEKTGSMHSLYLGLKEPRKCIVLDGDIIYSPKIILDLIRDKRKDIVSLVRCCNSGDEVYTVLENRRVIYLGKKCPNTEEVLEFTGISKFSKEFIGKMFYLHEENLKKGITNEYWEDCAFRTSRFLPWHGYFNKKYKWSEIDKKEDIPRLIEVFKKIKKE